MIRPVKNEDQNVKHKYKCPFGYKPCNEDFFDIGELEDGGTMGHDFVICIPEDSEIKEECPITSVSFVPSSNHDEQALTTKDTS